MSLQRIFPHLRDSHLLAFCREPEWLVVTFVRVTQTRLLAPERGQSTSGQQLLAIHDL